MKKIVISIIALLFLVVGGLWLYRADQLGINPPDSQTLVDSVSYRCDEGKTIQAAYYQGSTTPAEPGEPPVPNGSVVLELSDGRSLTASQTISASGIRYATADESFVFWSKGATAFVLEGDRQVYANCMDASLSLSEDLYPLYDGTQWTVPAPETITVGSTISSGVSVTSLPMEYTMNPASIFIPFEQYYAQKLAALDWEVDNDLAAGGHTGGQVGYRKGSQIILTRFTITYHTVPQDAPSECPCDMTLSLFSAQDPSF